MFLTARKMGSGDTQVVILEGDISPNESRRAWSIGASCRPSRGLASSSNDVRFGLGRQWGASLEIDRIWLGLKKIDLTIRERSSLRRVPP